MKKSTSYILLAFLVCTILLAGCKENTFQIEWTHEKAPEVFQAKFETTKGEFVIEVTRKLSPKAADRFYQLVRHGYYDNAIFYRVVPDFVAQFGNTDTVAMNRWRSVKIPDEPVLQGNKKGTVSFARLGKESRDLELFINLSNNAVLDTLHFEGVTGFPSLGTVIEGMETVEQLYSGYGETTMSDENLYSDRQLFYRTFPKLDLINKAYLVDSKL